MSLNPWRRVTDWPGLLAALAGEPGFVRLHRSTDRRITYRVLVEQSGALFVYSYGRRHWGERHVQWPLEWNRHVVFARPARTATAAERLARELALWSAYVLRYTRPGVWDELRAKASAARPATIGALRSAIASGTPEATALRQLGLPELEVPNRISRFQSRHTTTLRSQGAASHDIEQAHAAFYARMPFRLRWQGSYDCCASGELGTDGIYRGWLATEFRGCGNGHYYLLLDGFHAVFAEDD